MEEYEEAECERNSGFGWGFLVGTVLGGIAGVLLAPKPGRELRSDLKEKGTSAYGSARDVTTDSWTKAKAILDEAQLRATELKKEIDRQFTVTRMRMRDILQTTRTERAGETAETGAGEKTGGGEGEAAAPPRL